MSMSWTSAFGRACGVLLDTIVRWLALSRINPNVLTFMGLVVNTWAAILFGSANADNQKRMFFYAGLVIIFSGFFDSGRRTSRPRHQPRHPLRSLLRLRSRPLQRRQPVPRTPCLLRPRRTLLLGRARRLRHGQRHHGQLYPSPRREPDRLLPRRIHGAPRTPGPRDPRSPLQPHGPSPVGDRSPQHNHRNPPHALYLDPNARPAGSANPRPSRVVDRGATEPFVHSARVESAA